MKRSVVGLLLLACAITSGTATTVEAAAILPGVYNSSTLPSNDDGSTGLVSVGFTLDFFGTSYSQVYVNNNGNITFTGPLGTFTPFGLLTSSIPIIAPFFGDVDTRDFGQTTPDVTYGTGVFGAFNAFGVNWINVDYYSTDVNQTNRNSFQLILVDRSDTGVGNFDFIYNYDQIQWETGEASGSNTQGCGGSSARVGWTNGGAADFELAGSGVNGAFIDSGSCYPGLLPGPNALITHSLNSDLLGRYVFNVRNGQVIDPPRDQIPAPEPASMFLVGSGMAIAAARRRRAARK